MIDPKKLSPMDKLGLPPAKSEMEEAFRYYALQVIQGVELGLISAGDIQEKAITKINKAKDWIAQEQSKAFNSAAPVHDCVKWIIKNLNDPRNKN